MKTTKTRDPRRWSRLVVDGAKQTPSRAMLRAVGFTDADFDPRNTAYKFGAK